MPFASARQRSYLAINKPDVAKKFAADAYKPGKGGKGPLHHMFGKKGK